MPTKILAVDDSKTIRLAIKITFAAEDAEVVAINKGTEAVARAKQMRPDVILVDHTLAEGDISGVALCQQLRADPETRAIPLIFMVPARGGVAESVAASAGADVVVGKPFDTQDLLDRVGELVKRGVASRPAVAAASGGAVSAVSANPAPAGRAAAVVPSGAPTTSSRTPAPVAAAVPVSAAVKPAPASAAPAPTAVPASAPAANSVAAASPAASREIPIVMSIPFTPANAPSAGMLERLRKAGAAGAGVSPQALEALASLSAEVVERIAWEVVPELAEAILRERAQQQPPH